MTAVRLPERSLQPVAQPTPLLSRLRTLHERMLPPAVRYPVAADWYELAGRPAVLDRLATRPGGPVAGFCLAADIGPDLGLAVVGSAPSNREVALQQVAIPLAALARPLGDGLAWALPTRWHRTEQLQMTTETLQAFVRLEPLLPGADPAAWRREVFARAPFLRDAKMLGDRTVEVRGVGPAQLERFDWQPSARGRTLTTVVTATTPTDGFSFVFEIPITADDDVFLADPDAMVASVEVTASEG